MATSGQDEVPLWQWLVFVPGLASGAVGVSLVRTGSDSRGGWPLLLVGLVLSALTYSWLGRRDGSRQ